MPRTREEDKTAVRQAVITICNALNGGNAKELGLVIHEQLTGEHRTLQQSFWSALLFAQIEHATDPFDLRNEESVKLANQVRDMAKAHNWDLGLPSY